MSFNETIFPKQIISISPPGYTSSAYLTEQTEKSIGVFPPYGTTMFDEGGKSKAKINNFNFKGDLGQMSKRQGYCISKTNTILLKNACTTFGITLEQLDSQLAIKLPEPLILNGLDRVNIVSNYGDVIIELFEYKSTSLAVYSMNGKNIEEFLPKYSKSINLTYADGSTVPGYIIAKSGTDKIKKLKEIFRQDFESLYISNESSYVKPPVIIESAINNSMESVSTNSMETSCTLAVPPPQIASNTVDENVAMKFASIISKVKKEKECKVEEILSNRIFIYGIKSKVEKQLENYTDYTMEAKLELYKDEEEEEDKKMAVYIKTL